MIDTRIEDRDDTVMPETREDTQFGPETGLVLVAARREQLERDLATQVLVGGEEDERGATTSQEPLRPVAVKQQGCVDLLPAHATASPSTSRSWVVLVLYSHTPVSTR